MVARLLRALLLTLAASTVPVAARDGSVGLRLFDGLPLVPVSINGSAPRWFVIDTGSTTTTLSERLAGELTLAPTARVRIETTAGTVTGSVAAVDSVRVGTVELGSGEVVAQPLDAIGLPKDVEGVLGFDRLARVNFLVDYRRRTLQLDPDGELEANLRGGRVPFATSLGRPVVETRVQVRNEPERLRRLVVDTGATTPVLVDRIGDLPESKTLLTSAGPAHARQAEVVVTIGGATLPRMSAVILPPVEQTVREDQGLLPTSLFAWMYFDVVRREIMWARS